MPLSQILFNTTCFWLASPDRDDRRTLCSRMSSEGAGNAGVGFAIGHLVTTLSG